MKIALIVLAAGASKRLGQPKQVLPCKGKTLMECILKECLDSALGDVFVVLGSKMDIIQEKVPKEVSILKNENWKQGIGTSIACSIQNTQKYDAAFILLGDQPYFKKTILKSILKKQEESKASIVRSKYQKGNGPPVLFLQKHFSALLDLKGDMGAKDVIRKFPEETAFVPFEKGHVDIDTPSDLKNLT